MPPAELTGVLTVAPVPTMWLVVPPPLELLLEHPQSAIALDIATRPNTHGFRNLMYPLTPSEAPRAFIVPIPRLSAGLAHRQRE